jgi:hypothetical protein
MRTLAALPIVVAAACGGPAKQQPTVTPSQPIANTAPEPTPQPQPQPEPAPEPQPQPIAEDPPMVDDSGTPTTDVLGSTALQQGGAFASLTGTGDVSSGFDDTNIYGGLLGNEAGSLEVKLGTPVTKGKGKLGKAILRRQVKKAIPDITLCYEQPVPVDQTRPDTLEVQFTIEADGTVSAATTSVASSDIATCVAEVIKAIKFPKRKRGTLEVTYPFEVVGGELNGGFGFGRSGFGPGGGGTGWGTIGKGNYGSIGHGSGTGSGYGVGGGRGGMRGRSSVIPQVRLGQPTVTGDGVLDKAIIRRYIKRNIAKITYCYEKNLLAKPEIAGKLSTQFTIERDGKVTAATASGVDADVASCVSGVLGAIEFPKPKGDATVKVDYPFEFMPTGG